MANRWPDRNDRGSEDRDIFDAVPALGRATTQFERSFGPSCLLSLVITLLLLIISRRFMNLGWVGSGVMVIVTWYLVMILLTRWRAGRVVAEDD